MPIITALFMMNFTSSTATEIQDFPPEEFLGENRILAICGGGSLPSGIDWTGLTERDLVVIEPHSESLLFLVYLFEGTPVAAPYSASERLNKIMNCSNKSEFVLIGKDTGVKKRWVNTPSMDDLFQTIDAMPMRQYEMQTRGAN